MRITNRLIATATALAAIGAVLAGCTSPVAPDVRFSAEKLTISLAMMVVGTPVTETLPEAMGGEEDLVYSLSGAVPGLTFDPATRVLSGTPTTPGTYPMTYTAKDSATGGTMESVTFMIVVNARPLTNQERILGTWQKTFDWWHEDVNIGTFVDVLTFTETRFVFVRSHFLMDGSFEGTWTEVGTWTITDEEIVRKWYHNHDDDDETDEILEELPKPYWLLSDDDLVVNHWADSSGEDMALDRMTRVPELPPVGVWMMREWDSDSDRYFTETMTLASDGAFTWSEQHPNGTWTLAAQWELDAGNYFINLKNATETWTETGEDPVPDDRTSEASFLRFAYAPMSSSEPGERMIAVSYWRDELDERRYGNYWREMTLQQ
ncbi:MAG: Ig domain-containing protein [Spirochaetaceae bacterium]|nr:Ig domain-containing protein [Spirochaetaceae bacterium]